jgi:hypothetical protein
MTLVLECELLRATVAPKRGEIRSLVWLPTGEELLFQSPWEPRATRPDLRRDDEWVAAWPGGWTLLFPNAGNRCTYDGRDHGFHGAASLATWSVEDTTLTWTDESGLAVRRSIGLDGAALTVSTQIENRAREPRQYVMVEHLVLGPALGGPGARIAPGAAPVLRMANDGTPLAAPEPWPTADDWSTVPDAPFSRFGSLDGLDRVTVSRGALTATLRWTSLRGMWLWHEHRASAGFPLPITALGLEPATVMRSTVLARAAEDGTACILAPGERATSRVVLSVE